MDDVTREIAALEAARRATLVAGDKIVLAEMLSDTLIWTHATGATDSRASYLAGLGRVRFVRIDPVDETIAVYGNQAAVVTAELQMTIEPPNAAPIELRTRASSVWAREAGAWKLCRFHSGMVS